ncbi:response regulator [Paenibacillus yanchengensis]|uniref:Response regulator n=1 Tax=Paenibacillus yanchengensis TaxID=2035833 RepID=A0ABW4YIY3_9BACL
MFRVVIVEDEPLILQSIREKITSMDNQFKIVGEYENGEYALFELDVLKPHLLITDVNMPVMDGIQLIEHVKIRYPEMLCTIITGYRDFEIAHQALQLGVNHFLIKPPTADNIAPFLKQVKQTLYANQQLIEEELLQQFTLTSTARSQQLSSLFTMQEYFYYAYYIVVCIWQPIEKKRLMQVDVYDDVLKETLENGEKIYNTYNRASNEKLYVVGVYSVGEQRLNRLKQQLSSVADHNVAITIAMTHQLQTNLHGTLHKVRKTAMLRFPFEGSYIEVIDAEPVVLDNLLLPIAETTQKQLVIYLTMSQKQLFLDALFEVLQDVKWQEASRKQWSETLSFLFHYLQQHQSKEGKEIVANREASYAYWINEAEEIVFSADDQQEAIQLVLELFGYYIDTYYSDISVDEGWTVELKTYLESHFTENITLADLAQRFNRSASNLGRIFKHKYNYSPIDYLIHIRIKQAKHLIKTQPRLFFKDIAFMVGYQDPFYFSKLFKQITGQTPKEYKKSCME